NLAGWWCDERRLPSAPPLSRLPAVVLWWLLIQSRFCASIALPSSDLPCVAVWFDRHHCNTLTHYYP
ncbi:hypothetical protein A2U01_0061845, partial [Trifolium medium]|nr:hypothetical protein [Trifolium medium]